MRVRLTDGPDGAVVLEAPYRDWEPVRETFKLAVPWDGRKWDGSAKQWIISALYTADLLAFLAQHHARIQDDRHPLEAAEPRAPMPDELREAFASLHLASSAPLCVAEASYRALAKYYHPDVGGSAELFTGVSTAIAVVRHYLNPQESHDDALPF